MTSTSYDIVIRKRQNRIASDHIARHLFTRHS